MSVKNSKCQPICKPITPENICLMDSLGVSGFKAGESLRKLTRELLIIKSKFRISKSKHF